VPTLFIYGEHDFAVIPDTVRDLGRFINAPYREVRIPDRAHWVQNEAVDEVNAALLEFLADDSLKATSANTRA
jgi:pimeloyl-ACP methyl ester carboxylesterase